MFVFMGNQIIKSKHTIICQKLSKCSHSTIKSFLNDAGYFAKSVIIIKIVSRVTFKIFIINLF